MKFIKYLAVFWLTLVLAACGGGGGSPGTSLGSVPVVPTVPSFSVVAPSTLTLQVGLSQQYAIKGGVKPYAVISTDPAVATGWLIGVDTLAIGAVVPGKATVTALDANGSRFDIAVTSGSSTVLYTTASPAFTLVPGSANSQTFTIGGGTAPYTVVSNFTNVATASVNGNTMTVTGVQISNTPVTITLRDSAGATLLSSVTVGTVPLAANPDSFTMFIGDMIRAIITGGTPPYRTLVAIDESLLSVKISNGNVLEAVGGQVSTGAGITIVDANNQTVSISATISNGQDELRISPNVLNIPESGNTPNLTLMVYGASVTGDIQVFTSDTTILNPFSTVKNIDGTGYAIRLTGGNTCSLVVAEGPPQTGGGRTVTISVLDAKGKIGTSTITITDSNGIEGCSY